LGHPGWTSWNLDPVLILALVVVSGAYVAAYRRAGRYAASPPTIGHWLPFASGIAALVVALMSPLDEIGDTYLLSAHMIQHVLLTDVAAALIVLGLRAPVLPLGLPRKGLRLVAPRGPIGRFIHVMTRPWVALPLWAIATWVWSIPRVFDFAASHPTVHGIEHAMLFYTGIALWWLIIDPLPTERRKPHINRLAYLGFTRLASAAVCLPLTWLANPMYPLYEHAPRAYGISAIRDQQLAGASMCLIEFLIFGIAVAAVFIDVLGREERLERAYPVT